MAAVAADGAVVPSPLVELRDLWLRLLCTLPVVPLVADPPNQRLIARPELKLVATDWQLAVEPVAFAAMSLSP